MRGTVRPFLGSALLVVTLSACGSDVPTAETSPTSTPPSTVTGLEPAVTATQPTTAEPPTTEPNTTAPVESSMLSSTSLDEPTPVCPGVTFENIPAPWSPTIQDGQGDGSSLPGKHIERPGAFINLFPGGSIWAPTSPAALTVDGHPGQLGTVEDGLSVRVSLTEACAVFDFVAYGVSADELRAVIATVRFGSS